MSRANVWRKCVPVSGGSKWKGPEAGDGLVCLRNPRIPASMAAAESGNSSRQRSRSVLVAARVGHHEHWVLVRTVSATGAIAGSRQVSGVH